MTEKSKGDPRIEAELEQVRWRNRNEDNPNQHKPRIVFDFDLNKVAIEETQA